MFKLSILGKSLAAALFFAATSCLAQTPPFFNVQDYGATGNGVTIDSPGINAAIAAAAAAGGGTVTFPPGNYISLSIHLTNNVTLYLSNNAVILAAATTGFDPAESNPYSQYQDYGHSHFHDSLIWGENLTNVAIAGSGTISGNGNLTSGNPSAGQGDKAVCLIMCSNVSITGVTITAAGHFGILAQACTNMLVANAQILNAFASQHRDAFNLIDSSDVIVSNCVIQGSDDSMCLKSTYALGRKIGGHNIHIVNDQILSTQNNATQFGSETVGNFTDVTFSNLQLTAAGKAGIGITSQDGSIIDGVTYDNITMTNCACPIFLKLDYRTTDTPFPAIGRIRNISINNVTAVRSAFDNRTNTSTINGYFDGSSLVVPIENITFNNVSVQNEGGQQAAAITNYPVENQDWQPQNFGKWPSYGWYLRYARNLSFSNCQTHFFKNDDRPAVVVDTVTNVLFDTLQADIGQNDTNYDMGFLSVSNFDVTNDIASANAPSPGAALRIHTSNATPALVVTPPYFVPGDGIYTAPQSVAIASDTPGATIRYTADGTTPSSISGVIYSGPVTVNSETVLRAVAYTNGMLDSAVNTAIYNYPGTELDFGYQLSAAPAVMTMNSGNSTNLAVTMTTDANFGGATIALGVSGVPAGATASFNPPTLNTAGISTLTIQTATNTPGGNYVLTITGTNGVSSSATTVTLSLTGPAISPGTVLWTAASGSDINWSTSGNWTNMTAGGFGPPGLANSVVFTNSGTVATPATVNNEINSSISILSLQYSQTANYHTTLVDDGQTLTVAGNVVAGTGTDLGASGQLTAAITGSGGTLSINNSSASVIVRQGTGNSTGPWSQRATLDLSGLDFFNASLGRLLVAGDGANSAFNSREVGTLYLAATNSISASGTAPALCVADNPSNGAGSGNDPGLLTSYLYLGQTNAIFADTVTIGRSKCAGVMSFNPIFTNGLNPMLFLRGFSANPVTTLSIGDESALGSSNQRGAGTVDLSNGTVDALATTAYVGRSMNGNNSGTGVSAAGTLTFNAGSIGVNTLEVGYQTLGTGTGPGAVGTINVNGTGVLTVNQNLELAHGNVSSPAVQGVVNLNGGILQATNIFGGGGTSTINVNSGTLDLQSTNPTPGRIANMSVLNIGANSVSQPALLANAASINVSNSIVIAANGTLAGNTVVTSPGLTVNGAISPGRNGAAGGITNAGPLTLGTGGNYIVTVQDATAGPVVGWSFVQENSGINIQATGGNPFRIQLQSTGAANFNNNSSFDWPIATANNGFTNFNTANFAVNNLLFANDLAGGYFYVRSSNNSLILSFTNNHPPVAGTVTLYRSGNPMTIPVSTLAGQWSDPDGDPVGLASVNSTTNGAGVGTDGNFIYYTNANVVTDLISYTVQDVRTNPPALYRLGDTQRTAAGQIILLPPPTIASVTRNSGNLILNGSGGAPGNNYYVLSSTNLTLPLPQWTIIATNGIDNLGNFSFTNAINLDGQQSFYRLLFQ